MSLAKKILKLVAERDGYKTSYDATVKLNVKLTETLNKHKKCVEALYFQRGEGTAAIISEHLGSNYGINLEMYETYSKPLKSQLETILWPVTTNRTARTGLSSSKSTSLDGEPPVPSEERMKVRPG